MSRRVNHEKLNRDKKSTNEYKPKPLSCEWHTPITDELLEKEHKMKLARKKASALLKSRKKK